MINLKHIRDQFPILKEKVHGKQLIYFDNGASSQKPLAVIDALNDYYSKEHANVHRGVHTLSQQATEKFEEVRRLAQGFIHAEKEEEVIFTRGTTEGINLVASCFAKAYIEEGDEILISNLEHHSNIVPWQIVCDEYGAELKVIPVNEAGELIMDEFDQLLSGKTKMVAVGHISNALGTINPIKEIITKAHKVGAAVLIDGAQSAPHISIDVQDLDCDFYVLSSHKMYGPTGIGILYGKEHWLNEMPPYHGGGEMIEKVSFHTGTTFNQLPFKFEAGTPNIADTIAFGEAIKWVQNIGMEAMAKHEHELLTYATQRMQEIEGLRIIGTSENKAGVISFLVGEIHPYDIGTLLDQMGIAVRTGHHCAMPIMERYGIPGTVRASFAVYNTKEEIDVFIDSLKRAVNMLS